MLTQVDLGAVCALHRERKAKATIVLTPVDNPTRLRPGRDRRATATSSASSRSRSADEITCNTINAGIYVLEPDTFDRIPKDTAWSIERSFFPSLIERGETFVAYVYDGYWIDIGTPEKYMQVHRDIMDGRYSAPPFDGAPAAPGSRPDARVEDGVEIAGPVLHRRGRGRQGGRAHRALLGASAARRHVEEGAVVDGSIIWPNALDRPRGASCAARSSAATATSAATPTLESPARARRQDRHHRLQHDCRVDCIMTINPNIFKAYDVRGLYPGGVNEDGARGRSAAASSPTWRRSASPCRATCGCRRRRWPRRSSTARARRAPTSSTTA